MARQNWIVVICPKGTRLNPGLTVAALAQMVAEEVVIYREVWLSEAELRQVHHECSNSPMIEECRIIQGPPTARFNKGPGDLHRIIAKLNGGQTPVPPKPNYTLLAGSELGMAGALAMIAMTTAPRSK